MSGDKVSVLVCASARGDLLLRAACRGKMGVSEARAALAGCVLEGAVVSTDMQGGCARALAELGVAAHERFASSGPRSPPDLVNAVHSALKSFLYGFRGISTRRLSGYLAWFMWLREARRDGEASGTLGEQMPVLPYRLTWRQRVAAPYPFHPELSVSKEG